MAANNLQINVNVGGNALTQLQAVESRIKKTDAAVKQSARGYTVFGAAADKSTDKTRRFAQAGIQQAGFQLGDFAVQLQNGTSFLTAFGQQGSQLLGVFGAVGAVLGAVVAVGAALGTVFLKMRDTAGSLADEVDALEGALDDLSELTLTNEERFRHLRKEYSEVSKEVVKLFELQKRAAEFEVANSIRKTTEALNKEFRQLINLNSQLKEAEAQTGLFLGAFNEGLAKPVAIKIKEDIAKINEEFGITNEQGQKLVALFNNLNEIDAFENPTKAANELQQIIEILTTAGFENLTKSQFEAIQSMLNFEIQLRKTGVATSELRNQMGLTKDESGKLADGIASSFGSSFASIVKGTETVKDAFKNMAMSIIDQLLQVLVIQRLVSGISTGLQTQFPSLFGAPAPKGIGGSVQRGQPYLVGERGAELFVPSQSGSIVPNKDISGGNGVTINQTINVSTGVQQTVRTEIASLMPQIAEATKSAVADARMRGGSYSKAFGG